MRFLLALALLACTAAVPAAPVRTPHAEAELVAERGALEPGRPLTLALRLKPIPGWHTYWRNPGDSGQPTTLEWRLPPGFAAGEIRWPAPQKLPLGPLANYGYKGEVFLLTEVAVPASAAGTQTLAAHARWLVCNPEHCIPEQAQLTLALPTGPAAPSAWSETIARTRAELPRPLPSGWRLAARGGNAAARLELTPPAAAAVSSLEFFPYEEGKIHYAGAQPSERTETGLRLTIPASQQPVGEWNRLAGLLVADGRAYEIDVPIAGQVGAAAPVAPSAGDPIGLLAALAFAFAGGLILNLMPCVLPVLSIKVLGFAGTRDARAMRLHGALYAAGVVVSFLALAALLLALKGAGAVVGWGFQLQSPVFISALALLFFALALNLSGVFELGHFLPASFANLRAGTPHADAFLTGVLAVAVASPCTAPFMGAALGYAIAESATTSLAVFSALGIGMAAPYVVFAFRPQWLRWLPKPGPWMLRLKQALAFPLYGTVIWLAWVLGRQAGLDAVAVLLVALLALAVAAWLAGMPRARPAAVLIALLALALALPAAKLAPSAPAAQAQDAWEPWSSARVAALAAEGRPAFVDFTAAWCVTCQVNKQLVLGRPEVERAFRAKGVALLRADWTREDPEITRALAALGRSGVPVYVLYAPGRQAKLLPEILTREAVLAALAELPT